MAGIGVKLQKIYDRRTILANLAGFGYSTMVTIAPMFVVIGNVMLMSHFLGYETVGYARRGLFSGTVLYIFIFSLLVAAPFNAVLSRYMSDIIYEEKYEDILPCYDVGLFLNICFGCLFAIPFCIREYLKGQVDLVFVFTGFCGFISLLLVFYSMLYLSICKDYQKISLFFLMGMAAAFGLAWLLVKVFHRDIIYSMLLSLTIGFFLTAAISAATIKSYFKRNSRQYRKVLHYFKIYWHLIATNLHMIWRPVWQCLRIFRRPSFLSAAWKCIFMRGTRHIRRLLSVADGKISIMQKTECSASLHLNL